MSNDSKENLFFLTSQKMTLFLHIRYWSLAELTIRDTIRDTADTILAEIR